MAILGIGVLLGLYRGFLQSLLNLVGTIASFVLSFVFYPKLADSLSCNEALMQTIRNFTDSSKLLGSLDLSNLSVANLSETDIAAIVDKAQLPSPLSSILKSNLANQVFQPLGDLATTVGDYVNQTLVSTCLNVLCFIICFLAFSIAVSILVNLFRKVFKLPALRLLDSLAGGVAGFFSGIIVCVVLFSLLPLVEGIINLEGLNELISASKYAHYFQGNELLMAIMNRKII